MRQSHAASLPRSVTSVPCCAVCDRMNHAITCLCHPAWRRVLARGCVRRDAARGLWIAGAPDADAGEFSHWRCRSIRAGRLGDREDPHAPGSAGQGTTPCAGPRSSAASGLTTPIPHCSSVPARGAAGVGCVPAATGPMETAYGQGVTRRLQPERRISAGLSTPNRPQPAPKDRFKRLGRCVPPLCCRVRGAVEKEKGRLKRIYPRRHLRVF